MTGDDFRDLYNAAPSGLLTTTLDGRITQVNDTLLEWSGRDRDAVVGTDFAGHLDAGSRIFFETRHNPVLHLQGVVREVSLALERPDGSRKAVLVSSVVRGDTVHTAVFEATERQEYERDLLDARRGAEASEARVRVLQLASSAFGACLTEDDVCAALESSARQAFPARETGVFLLDEHGEFVLMAGSNPTTGLIPPGSPRASDVALVEETVVTLTSADIDGPFGAVVHALQARRLEAVSIVPLMRDGIALGVFASFYGREPILDEGMSELQAALGRLASQAIVRVRLQAELERSALYDPLTLLANRRSLQNTVADSILGASETGRPLAVVFLDLDGFKAVNDQLGHLAGDSALQQVALRLRQGVRHDDAVGRYGGDEFVAVCQDADAEGALAIAERIRAAVEQPLDGIPASLPITTSIGIALYTPSDTPPPSTDEMLGLADDAMYLSKSAGKNRVTLVPAG